MPPQQRNENVVDTQPAVSTTPTGMRRITSNAYLSDGGDSAGDSPRGAHEYRVRKSSLIGYVIILYMNEASCLFHLSMMFSDNKLFLVDLEIQCSIAFLFFTFLYVDS